MGITAMKKHGSGVALVIVRRWCSFCRGRRYRADCPTAPASKRADCPLRALVSPTGSCRVPAFQTLSEARSRLDQRRFLRPLPHSSAFFEPDVFSFVPLLISRIFQDRKHRCWADCPTAPAPKRANCPPGTLAGDLRAKPLGPLSSK